MPLVTPFFSNSFEKIRSMKDVDLGEMFNESVIGLGNSLLQAAEPDTEPTPEAPETPDPYAIDDAQPKFSRLEQDPFSSPFQSP